jgi:hypothetical protein
MGRKKSLLKASGSYLAESEEKALEIITKE